MLRSRCRAPHPAKQFCSRVQTAFLKRRLRAPAPDQVLFLRAAELFDRGLPPHGRTLGGMRFPINQPERPAGTDISRAPAFLMLVQTTREVPGVAGVEAAVAAFQDVYEITGPAASGQGGFPNRPEFGQRSHFMGGERPRPFPAPAECRMQARYFTFL